MQERAMADILMSLTSNNMICCTNKSLTDSHSYLFLYNDIKDNNIKGTGSHDSFSCLILSFPFIPWVLVFLIFFGSTDTYRMPYCNKQYLRWWGWSCRHKDIMLVLTECTVYVHTQNCIFNSLCVRQIFNMSSMFKFWNRNL